MLKLDRTRKIFDRLPTSSFTEAALLERADLQECIWNSSDAFFTEMGERLFVIGKEVLASDSVQDRIDILAIDPEGQAVIVELKRGSNKLQMLQAISYAGMVARWNIDDFRALVSEDEWEALIDFLEVDVDEINRRQRLLLIAESYDYALLSGAEWLSEQHGVDIRCSALTLATDETSSTEYLACTGVFPPQTLAERAKGRGRSTRSSHRSTWHSWKEALETLQNEALVKFARVELAEGRDTYLRRRGFHYRLEGKRRWTLQCRRKSAYVWQRGRFENDIDFWLRLLGDDASVKMVKAGAAISFSLTTAHQLDAFREAATQTLAARQWL